MRSSQVTTAPAAIRVRSTNRNLSGRPIGADASIVRLIRPHVAVVAVAIAATAAVFAFARPAYHRRVEPAPPDHGLRYTHVAYTAADARRAFAAEGVALIPRWRLPQTTDLSDRGLVVEVTVFGDPKKVAATGFYDYTIDASGQYVHFSKTCANGARDAERWRGNVRAIVSCTAAGAGALTWLGRVERAFARLPAR
jgi:hypothetical protein